MERDGLIKRTRDPSDGRSSQIVLTKVAEASQLVDLLTRLIDNFDQLTGAETVS